MPAHLHLMSSNHEAPQLTTPRTVRLTGSAEQAPLSHGLLSWDMDPVARRYSTVKPSSRVQLKHKRFSEALLYAGPHDGAIILMTADGLVMAMDYCERDDLEYHWRETLRHYAGVI